MAYKASPTGNEAVDRNLQLIAFELKRLGERVAARARVIVKTDTGDPATGADGDICINTLDATLKQYADGAWRTLVFW